MRKPERLETNRARQQRLRERRNAQGFKRITIWLSPEQVDTLESFGGEPWLGTTVKAFLESAMNDSQRAALGQGSLFENASNEPTVSDTPEPLHDTDKAALWAEADSLNASGLSWEAIARRWNGEGRRTVNGAEFRGGNIRGL